MEFSQIIMKNGKSVVGYITNSDGSQLHLLAYEKNKKLIYTALSKSAIQDIKEGRTLNENEVSIVKKYMSLTKEIADTNYKLRELNAYSKHLFEKREKEIEKLVEETILAERKNTDTLKISDILGDLTETGFKNLFLLQRANALTTNEKDEFVVVEGHKRSTYSLKHQATIVLVLNDNDTTKDKVMTLLKGISSEEELKRPAETVVNKQEPKSNINAENEMKAETKKEATPGTLNLHNIQDKLNEHGFQTLRKLQENEVLTIHPDGTMDFGELRHIPFIGNVLNDEKEVVEILNKAHAFPFNMLPLTFEKRPTNGVPNGLSELGNILNEVQKQFFNIKKKE